MEKSVNPSNHILIKSWTTSDWDQVDFALVELSESFREVLAQRLATAQLFTSDNSFHNLSYWDSPVGYYCNSLNRLHSDDVIPEGEDWTYITLSPEEEEALPKPENQLEGHQMIVTKRGYAYFKALSKHSSEEYLTESFSINELLKNHVSKSNDSS